MLRPVATRWFEVLCPRGESVTTLAELARTGAVQLELREVASGRDGGRIQTATDPRFARGLAKYQELEARYRRYWQRGRLRHAPLTDSAADVLQVALGRLSAWQRHADPVIDRLQACEEEQHRLSWLERIVARLVGDALDFSLVAQSGPVLGTFCAILPADVDPDLPEWAIARGVPWADERC